jgi:hypothetical protein
MKDKLLELIELESRINELNSELVDNNIFKRDNSEM